MTKYIIVGFGQAQLLRNGQVVLDGEERWGSDQNLPLPTFADAERLAIQHPNDDWRVVLNGPLHGETYQRHGPGVWVIIERNEGFA